MASVLKELVAADAFPHCVESVVGFPARLDKIQLIYCGLRGPCLPHPPFCSLPVPQPGPCDGGMKEGHRNSVFRELCEVPAVGVLCQCALIRIGAQGRIEKPYEGVGFYLWVTASPSEHNQYFPTPQQPVGPNKGLKM